MIVRYVHDVKGGKAGELSRNKIKNCLQAYSTSFPVSSKRVQPKQSVKNVHLSICQNAVSMYSIDEDAGTK